MEGGAVGTAPTSATAKPDAASGVSSAGTGSAFGGGMNAMATITAGTTLTRRRMPREGLRPQLRVPEWKVHCLFGGVRWGG